MAKSGASRPRRGDKHGTTCLICFESEFDDMWGLACGHDFCRACWRGYLSHAVASDGPACVRTTCPAAKCAQLVTRDASAPEDSHISVHVGDGVEEAYADAQRRGLEIVHPLTTEEWGVRRFFVRAPDGTIVNVVSHAD